MQGAIGIHMDNLLQRLATHQISYDHIAGAVDALLVANVITLADSVRILTVAKRYSKKEAQT